MPTDVLDVVLVLERDVERARARPDDLLVPLERDLSDSLGLKVELSDKDGKGQLTLRYGSLEQLDDLCRRLMRG